MTDRNPVIHSQMRDPLAVITPLIEAGAGSLRVRETALSNILDVEPPVVSGLGQTDAKLDVRILAGIGGIRQKLRQLEKSLFRREARKKLISKLRFHLSRRR